MEDLISKEHLLRLIDKAIDLNFIYDLVEDKYCHDNGRPSMDLVMLIKIPFIQYLYGIRSMRQTIKEIEVNVAYRWFLGLDMLDKVPHFSTFGKNYSRRFKDTDLFEQIFSHILEECYKFRLVDPSEVFVDATHVKARANGHKMRKRIAKQEALFYEDMLKKEINEDRAAYGKKPLKDNDDDNTPSSGYKQAFSVLHASNNISLEINKDMNRKKIFNPSKKPATACMCLALTLCAGLSVYAANYFLGYSIKLGDKEISEEIENVACNELTETDIAQKYYSISDLEKRWE